MVELEPKEVKIITFQLTEKELGFYNNSGDFIVESGDFKVFVGGSSVTDLEAQFEL